MRLGHYSAAACLRLVSSRTEAEDASTWDGQVLGLVYQEKLKDHMEAYRSYYRSCSISGINKIWSILLLFFGLFLLLAVGPLWWTLIWIPLAAAEWLNLLGLAVLYFRFLRHKDSFNTENRIVFSTAGISYRKPSVEYHCRWSMFIRCLESETSFLLVRGTWNYCLVPKRIFKNQVEVDRFRDLLKEHVGPVRKLDRGFGFSPV